MSVAVMTHLCCSMCKAWCCYAGDVLCCCFDCNQVGACLLVQDDGLVHFPLLMIAFSSVRAWPTKLPDAQLCRHDLTLFCHLHCIFD